jgi:myo-inositol-1(or 4)-monophosphatase
MARPAPEQIEEWLNFARGLARMAGERILPWFRHPVAIERKSAKGGFDPVTAADRAGEEIMRTLIATAYPDHGITGEETGATNDSAPFIWQLDPIDGTRAFITGIPTWGTLVSLTLEGIPLLGVMSQPFTGEQFYGAGGQSFHSTPHGTTRLRTRPCPDLSDAVLASTDHRLFADGAERQGFTALQEKVRLTCFGGDCTMYCMLAAGHIDLIAEAGLSSYDISALIPIIEGAGGRVTAWDGGPAAGGGTALATGDPALHERALSVLSTGS